MYDLDERQKDAKGIEERMFMDLSQAQSMQMWPTVEDSEIELGCEDGSVSLPCDAGIRTVFHSSTHGVGGDNPTDVRSTNVFVLCMLFMYVFLSSFDFEFF